MYNPKSKSFNTGFPASHVLFYPKSQLEMNDIRLSYKILKRMDHASVGMVSGAASILPKKI
jgi:hypothetical protein